MSEGKVRRLKQVATEFGQGTTTIVDFFNKKGIELGGSPMEKITEDMYNMLCKDPELAQDRKTNQTSDNIVITKAKDTPKPEPKQEPKPEPKVEAVPEPKVEEVKPEVVVEKTAPVAEPAPQPVKPTEVEIVPTPEPVVNTGGVKVLGKVDLDAITKNKRGRGKKEEPAPVIKEEKVTKSKKTTTEKIDTPAPPAKEEKVVPKPVVKIETPVVVAPIVAPVKEEPKVPIIENVVKLQKLEGLTIMGKMILPTTPSGRNGGPSSADKKKRKRIIIGKDGKPVTNTAPPGARGPYTRPAGQGGAPGNAGGYNRGPAGPGGANRGPGGGPNRGPGGYNRGTGGRFGDNKPAGDKVINQNEIQEKIKQTLAKLGGGGGKRNQKSKYRKDKRVQFNEKMAAQERDRDDTILQVTEFISVNELASLMDVSFAEVIGKCMGLGMMVSINQRLDAEVIELVASEFGFTVQFINLEQEADNEEEVVDDPENLETRPPIVTIMGHVDHGKTSLLDYIRNANVVAGESGGITQHIGAYEVTLPNGKQITFLDTPGHEAFTAMRARGTKVTDLAIIVVAADDAVMPQTKEAISHAQAGSVPMIFAINKMDKDGANPEKIYEQLSGMNILVEEWGGKFQSQGVSAKKGLNVDALLDKIVLESDMMDLKANPNREASGSIIEASLDKGRGYVATMLVQNGTLKVGDMMVAGSIYGRVKAMYNERGGKVKTAGPSTPVQILGLNGAPQAGEKFKIYTDEDEARETATHRAQILREQGMRTRKHITLDEIGRRLALGNFKQLNVIIKGDVDGSVEALSDSLQKLSTEEVAVSVVHKGVGGISESDVNLATASDAIIIGFQVRANNYVFGLAEKENIEIRYYSVIYDAINDVKGAMEGLLEPKIEQKRTSNVEVREIFKITGVGIIAGCFVTEGKIIRQNKVNIIRDGIVVHTGELAALKRFKDDVKDVQSGTECGISIKNFSDLKVGDVIESFEEIEVKRTL